MNLLLDTCAISELRKPDPSPSFLEWFNDCNERLLYLSSITLGELRFGLDLLEEGRRKNDLLNWYAQLCLSYRGHIVTPSQKIYERWGNVASATKTAWAAFGDG